MVTLASRHQRTDRAAPGAGTSPPAPTRPAVPDPARTARLRTVEVTVPLFSHGLCTEVLRGIEEVLAASGCALVVRTLERAADRARLWAVPAGGQPRGQPDGRLVVIAGATWSFVPRLHAASGPLVLVDAVDGVNFVDGADAREGADTPTGGNGFGGLDGLGGDATSLPPRAGEACVVVDHEAAAALAVRHLLALGHRRIGLVEYRLDLGCSPTGRPRTLSRRQRGYRAALAAAGLPVVPSYEQVVGFDPQAGLEALDALLALPEPPTAMFAGSDVLALGLLEGARRRGRRVPDDVAVVGYGDVDAHVAAYVGLTTVRAPLTEAGRLAATLLLERLRAPAAGPADRQPGGICLTCELVVRHTCGAAYGSPPYLQHACSA